MPGQFPTNQGALTERDDFRSFQSSNSPAYIQTSGVGHQDNKSLQVGFMKALGAGNILQPPNTSQASLAWTNLGDCCAQQETNSAIVNIVTYLT